MKNSTSDFPPLTPRQLDLLEELKVEIGKRDDLSALNPDIPKINKRIDGLSVVVLRFAFKNIPKESRRPGEFIIEVPTYGGRLLPGEHRLEIKPGFGIFRPDLPPWAENHFIKWVREHRAGFRRYDGREVLRETGIVGIETGMSGPPIKLKFIKRWELIKQRVLQLRCVKKQKTQNGDLEENENDDLHHWLQDRNRMKITPAMVKNALIKKERKRTRKISATWDMVIDQLVKEQLLTRIITRQAFRNSLRKHFPDYPWNKV